jgi:hypothetical protein
VLRRSLDAAKLGKSDKADGLRRLDKLVRNVEKFHAPVADFDRALKHEKAISASVGGRTVFDDRPRDRQLRLF